MAAAMGIELLTEEQYRELQELGAFDTKTSSWVRTPSAIRKLGGALFCDRRYDPVFVYHNGAESYYAARGFRGWLRVYILHADTPISRSQLRMPSAHHRHGSATRKRSKLTGSRHLVDWNIRADRSGRI